MHLQGIQNLIHDLKLMFSQGRFALVVLWLSWLIGGICGVLILLVVIFHCCLMPKKQSSEEKQYCHDQMPHGNEMSKMPNWQMQRSFYSHEVVRPERPMSYAGHSAHSTKANHCNETVWNHHSSHEKMGKYGYINRTPTIAECTAQYASSSILDDMGEGTTQDSLKTRSLPAFLRSKQRPLSTEDDLHQLYAKVNFSKKRKNRMRNDDAAVIALSKSRSQCLNTDAVVVYDERTAL